MRHRPEQRRRTLPGHRAIAWFAGRGWGYVKISGVGWRRPGDTSMFGELTLRWRSHGRAIVKASLPGAGALALPNCEGSSPDADHRHRHSRSERDQAGSPARPTRLFFGDLSRGAAAAERYRRPVRAGKPFLV